MTIASPNKAPEDIQPVVAPENAPARPELSQAVSEAVRGLSDRGRLLHDAIARAVEEAYKRAMPTAQEVREQARVASTNIQGAAVLTAEAVQQQVYTATTNMQEAAVLTAEAVQRQAKATAEAAQEAFHAVRDEAWTRVDALVAEARDKLRSIPYPGKYSDEHLESIRGVDLAEMARVWRDTSRSMDPEQVTVGPGNKYAHGQTRVYNYSDTGPIGELHFKGVQVDLAKNPHLAMALKAEAAEQVRREKLGLAETSTDLERAKKEADYWKARAQVAEARAVTRVATPAVGGDLQKQLAEAQTKAVSLEMTFQALNTETVSRLLSTAIREDAVDVWKQTTLEWIRRQLVAQGHSEVDEAAVVHVLDTYVSAERRRQAKRSNQHGRPNRPQQS